MSDQPNLELIADTWRKMMGDPANLMALTFGEVEDFIIQVNNLAVYEQLNRHFSLSLVLDISRSIKDPDVSSFLEAMEKMLRVREMRARLNELAGVDFDE